MTTEREKQLEKKIEEMSDKIDALSAVIPGLQALGELLIEADFVTKTKGLNPKTISKNSNLEKYQGLGQRKLLMSLSTVNVVKQKRKKPIRIA